jgi:hypothetical protein
MVTATKVGAMRAGSRCDPSTITGETETANKKVG